MGYPINPNRAQPASLDSFRKAAEAADRTSGEHGYIKLDTRNAGPDGATTEARPGTRSGPLGRFWTWAKNLFGLGASRERGALEARDQLKAAMLAEGGSRASVGEGGSRAFVEAGRNRASVGEGGNRNAVENALRKHGLGQESFGRLQASKVSQAIRHFEIARMEFDDALEDPRFPRFLLSHFSSVPGTEFREFNFLQSLDQLRAGNPIEVEARGFDWLRQEFFSPDGRQKLDIEGPALDDIVNALNGGEIDRIHELLAPVVASIRKTFEERIFPKFQKDLLSSLGVADPEAELRDMLHAQFLDKGIYAQLLGKEGALSLDEALRLPAFRDYLASIGSVEQYDFLAAVDQLRPGYPIEIDDRSFEPLRQQFIAEGAPDGINIASEPRTRLMAIRTLDDDGDVYTDQEKQEIRAALEAAAKETRGLIATGNLSGFKPWLSRLIG